MTYTENVALRKAAAERAARIRAKASDLIQEIADAFNDKDHLALGYSTWHEYCAHELNGSIAIPSVKGDRVDFVRGLSAAGLSQRAISEATGVARNTVARYINPPVAQFEPPQDETVLSARRRTDEIRSILRTSADEDDTALDVLLDPWIIRAILLGSLTPVEAVESAQRLQGNQLADNVDDQTLDQFVTGLLTRTGRWIGAYNPDIPLSEHFKPEQEP